MSELTLDEAIKHCLEVAERYETRAKIIDRRKLGFALENPTACHECAADHRQLAEWLTELKQIKAIIAGYGIVNMQKLDMILAMIRTNSESAWTRIEREKELAETKRLLKLAVDDIETAMTEGKCKVCGIDYCGNYTKCKWRYVDEALKLIGGSENV